MRTMTESSPGIWLVSDDPSQRGVIVYRWSAGDWSCDGHGHIGWFPPTGAPSCDHVEFVRAQQVTADDREAPNSDLRSIDAAHDNGERDLTSPFAGLWGENF